MGGSELGGRDGEERSACKALSQKEPVGIHLPGATFQKPALSWPQTGPPPMPAEIHLLAKMAAKRRSMPVRLWFMNPLGQAPADFKKMDKKRI